MSQIIVTTITTTPPTTFVHKTYAEASLAVGDWAKKRWGEIFDMSPPDDYDTVVSRVLHAEGIIVHNEIKTLQ